ALAVAVVMNFVSYFFSDKIALSMYRAKPVTREELPRAYQIVERLTQKIGLPMPKIYVIPTEPPKAFATGRNPRHASGAGGRHKGGAVKTPTPLFDRVGAPFPGPFPRRPERAPGRNLLGGWEGGPQ